MSELKPCPFCESLDIEVTRIGTNRCSCIITCNYCGASRESGEIGYGYDWNTRPIEDALTQRVKELEEQLEDQRLEAKNERD